MCGGCGGGHWLWLLTTAYVLYLTVFLVKYYFKCRIYYFNILK